MGEAGLKKKDVLCTSSRINCVSHMWQCILLVLELGIQRQEELCELDTSLVYVVSSRPARGT